MIAALDIEAFYFFILWQLTFLAQLRCHKQPFVSSLELQIEEKHTESSNLFPLSQEKGDLEVALFLL